MQSKVIVYWITTAILALELLVGGVWDLAHQRYVVQIITHLGYPIFLLNILGVWKLLGALALLVPRLLRLKEWAYAGIVFEMTGAAASHAASGDSPGNLIAPVVFTIIAFVSWGLRPQSGTLGEIRLTKMGS